MAIVGAGGSQLEPEEEKGLTLHALKTEGGVDCTQGLADRKVSQACRGAHSGYDWAKQLGGHWVEVQVPSGRATDGENMRKGIGRYYLSHSIHLVTNARWCSTMHDLSSANANASFTTNFPGCCSQVSSSRRTSVPFFPQLCSVSTYGGVCSFPSCLRKIRTDRISQCASPLLLSLSGVWNLVCYSGCLLCRVSSRLSLILQPFPVPFISLSPNSPLLHIVLTRHRSDQIC